MRTWKLPDHSVCHPEQTGLKPELGSSDSSGGRTAGKRRGTFTPELLVLALCEANLTPAPLPSMFFFSSWKITRIILSLCLM